MKTSTKVKYALDNAKLRPVDTEKHSHPLNQSWEREEVRCRQSTATTYNAHNNDKLGSGEASSESDEGKLAEC